jgi:hypothetical protein
MKQQVRHYGHSESDETRTLGQKGWGGIDQDIINRRIDSTSARLRQLAESDNSQIVAGGRVLQPGETIRRKKKDI